ncbi:hypothetical protein K458DRAFT_126490 [Lentithecium fluviatile CBS 122367]|uniref:Uncharacterized protein n=1 Tax=Lentithecium fluviatile CBS 122367 TaxID=1168545 RepID=A0A6G1JGL5_9PLEO|nr:hypothetical protein K458DRAFT_126490 [Lentithecium fluviatile CBS 122367]
MCQHYCAGLDFCHFRARCRWRALYFSRRWVVFALPKWTRKGQGAVLRIFIDVVILSTDQHFAKVAACAFLSPIVCFYLLFFLLCPYRGSAALWGVFFLQHICVGEACPLLSFPETPFGKCYDWVVI